MKRLRVNGKLRAPLSSAYSRTSERPDLPPVTVSHAELVALWHAQNGRCAYTGASMGVSRRDRPHDVTLDRVDPSLGYVPGNVALVTRRVNNAKGGLLLDEFIDLCEQVAAAAKRRRRDSSVPVIAARQLWWRWFCWRRQNASHR